MNCEMHIDFLKHPSFLTDNDEVKGKDEEF